MISSGFQLVSLQNYSKVRNCKGHLSRSTGKRCTESAKDVGAGSHLQYPGGQPAGDVSHKPGGVGCHCFLTGPGFDTGTCRYQYSLLG